MVRIPRWWAIASRTFPCIMTNHVHLVFRCINGFEPQLVLGDFKRFTSKVIVRAIIENPKESRKEWLLE
ncbi:MAG: hypothetical protein JXA77_03760 [Bacteroidales bacterium]|nr:hypothetical protein [Bacteroidales bacterium]